MIAFASSLDQCGPLTRDVTDAAMLLRHLQSPDPMDSTCVGIEAGVELPSRTDLKGLRVGVARDFSGDAEGVEPGVAAAFAASLDVIRDLGAEVGECELPHAEHGISAYYVLAPAEASSNLARYDGVRYGMRENEPTDLTEMYETTRAAGFGGEVKRRIMLGTYALSSGYYDAYYGRAQRVRTKIASDFRAAFSSFDLIATPTSPTVAFELGARTKDPLAMYLSDYFTVPMSLAGIPAISIPCGLAEPGGGGPELPVGLQLTSPAFTETLLLDAAHAVEGAVAFDGRPR
jgi:aspartyl-tRNA(Asn)/glutamyl-tRNA(Gln) amidotransferase subunit A